MPSLADQLRGLDEAPVDSLASKLGEPTAQPTPQPTPAPTATTAPPDTFNGAFNPLQAGADVASKTLGSLADRLTAPIPQESQEMIANKTAPIRSGLEWGFRALETPLRVADTALNKIENMGHEVPAPKTNITQAALHPEQSANMGDVIASNPAYMPGDPMRGSLSQKLGMIGDVAYDPINWGGGALAKGVGLAGKLGGEAVGGAVNMAEKIPGPIGDLTTKAKTLAEKLQAGVTPITHDEGFNRVVAEKRLNPQNYEIVKQNEALPENQRYIADQAGSAKTTPDQLRQNILDTLEPRGSQAEVPKGQPPIAPEEQEGANALLEGNRAEAMKKLSPEVQEYAGQLRDLFQGAQEREHATGTTDYAPRENYVPHVMTPEAQDWIKKNLPEEQHSKLLQNLSGADKSFSESRTVHHTINEANNLMAMGKGSEIDGMGGFKKLNEFKGKLFNDNIEELAANRYLQSKKVQNEHDFMQSIGKTYGKPYEAVKMSDNPNQFVHVDSPSFKGVAGAEDNRMWFPKEIGNYLNRTNELQTGAHLNVIQKVLKGLNTFTKQANFGIWPASATKIELGNQTLAWLSDLWSPHSQWVGHSIAAKVRQGGIEALDATRPVISTPKLGALTEKDLYEQAQKNRGIGMGLFRSEFPSFNPDKSGLWGKAVGLGWKAHNYVEDGTRLGTFTEALKQGHDGFSAGQATQKALYDYSALGPVDKAIQKYAPIPFYTFARKNIPAMIGKTISNPGKFFAYEKARDVMDKNDKMNDYWQEWQSENMPIPIHTDQNGQVYYLFAGHLLPQTDLNALLGSGRSLTDAIKATPEKWPKYAMGMINPFVRTPLMELPMNRSAYFGTDIQKMGTKPGMQSDVQDTQLGFNAPAKLAYTLRNLVRAPSEIGRATNESVPLPLRAIRELTGANIQQVDPELQKQQAEQGFVQNVKGGGKTGGEADVRRYSFLQAYYAGKANDAKAKGDDGASREFMKKSALAKENMGIAMENLKKTLSEAPQ